MKCLDIVKRHGWDTDVLTVPALNHILVERIAPDVERRILELREQYDQLLVGFGDCDTSGKLDELLVHHGIDRVAGPHCYEMYAGTNDFKALMEEELGSFFLPDFLVGGFKVQCWVGHGF